MKVNCDSQGISTAIESIRKGGVIVFPTDTVYGIGCDPYDEGAVKKIFEVKNRDIGKAVPVLGDSKDTLSKIVRFDEIANTFAEKFWPGQLTMVLELNDDRLKKSLMLADKIAVRIPSGLCITKILQQCKLLVGTSANHSGAGSFSDPIDCKLKKNDYDVFVDGGKITSAGESTIVEFDKGKIIFHRIGAISKEELESCI